MESLGWPFWLAAVIFLFTLLAAIELFIGNRSVEALRDTPFVTEANPTVCKENKYSCQDLRIYHQRHI
jgi:hypothetical protein